MSQVVYFAVSDGFLKIGTSVAVDERMAYLQVGSPREITLLAAVPGDEIDEDELKRQFADYHVRGEWFALCAGSKRLLEKYIDAEIPSARLVYRAGRKPVQTKQPAPPPVPVAATDPSYIGRRLGQLLASAGLSQRELAAKIGINQSAVSHWVNGRFLPSAASLASAVAALGMTMAEFYAEAA